VSSGADFFLKKTLGDDFFELLQKFELWKPGTRTTLDHEEIKTALHIVPRTVMSMLVKELTPMNVGETKEISLQVAKDAVLKISKHERDVYSGQIEQENKIVVDFKYRSLPGVGLIIMSAFELYETEKLSQAQPEQPAPILAQVQKLIDERLALHDLIGKVVDKKIMEKDAIDKLVLIKLTEAMASAPSKNSEPQKPQKKNLPLKEFLESRKLKKNEFQITMAKGEKVDCPDCQKNIFDGDVFAGCVCLGDDMDRKVYIKKNEDGIKVRFGKGWDVENMEMLLEVLRSRRG